MKIIEITDSMPVPVILESEESGLYQHITLIAVEEKQGDVYIRRRDEIQIDVFGRIKINAGRQFNGRILIIQRIGGT